jgi:signal transduction histidine kinase
MAMDTRAEGIHPEIQSKFASGERAGVGLRGMRERVKQIGGTLGIHSNGNCASVLVTLPLTEETVSSDEGEATTFQNELTQNPGKKDFSNQAL